MSCSEARLNANRANALRSTGPTTIEGKEASRQNALKHGLTGQGIVVPGEDAAEIDRRFYQLRAELASDGSATSLLLAQRVAALSVRLERSVRQEFAATAERVQRAGDDFDEFRRAEAQRLLAEIEEEPGNRVRLRELPEGVDLLVATLRALRHEAAGQSPVAWSADHGQRLLRCTGAGAGSRGSVLTTAITTGDFGAIDSSLVARLAPAAQVRWALGQITELIDAELARLETHRRALDLAPVVTARRIAVEQALVDDSPATLAARRYEAASERSFFRALKELRDGRAQPAVEPIAADSTATSTALPASQHQLARLRDAAPPLGSFFPEAAPPPEPRDAATITVARPGIPGPSRPADRKKRPKLPR